MWKPLEQAGDKKEDVEEDAGKQSDIRAPPRRHLFSHKLAILLEKPKVQIGRAHV